MSYARLVLAGSLVVVTVTGCGGGRDEAARTRTVTVTASHPVQVPAPSTASSSSTAADVPQDEGTWETTPPATHGPESMGADSEKTLLAAAKRFVELWARPTVGEAQWRAALNPLLTRRGQTLIQWTDPANVPALRISGNPQRVAAGDDGPVFPVMVPTAQGNLVIDLASTPTGGWLVDGFTLPAGIH